MAALSFQGVSLATLIESLKLTHTVLSLLKHTAAGYVPALMSLHIDLFKWNATQHPVIVVRKQARVSQADGTEDLAIKRVGPRPERQKAVAEVWHLARSLEGLLWLAKVSAKRSWWLSLGGKRKI